PLLAGFFLDLYRRRLGLGPVRLTEPARQVLTSADWPGNVRELDHLLGRAVLRASADVERGSPIRLHPEHLRIEGISEFALSAGDAASRSGSVGIPLAGKTLKEAVEETKRWMVRRAVEESGGNWAAAARSLGMA